MFWFQPSLISLVDVYLSSHSGIMVAQANVKLNEQQLASLSSPKAVNEFLEHQKDNILNAIKQNLAVGDIYIRENLQVNNYI
jgi:trigger factor